MSDSNSPLSPWAYFGYNILFNIPVIGWIIALILAFSANNINLKNYAKSFFCVYIIAIVIILVLVFLSLSGAILLPLFN